MHALPPSVVAYPWPSTQHASAMLKERIDAALARHCAGRLAVTRKSIHTWCR